MITIEQRLQEFSDRHGGTRDNFLPIYISFYAGAAAMAEVLSEGNGLIAEELKKIRERLEQK